MLGKYLNLGAVGTVGNAATSWTVTRALGPNPVLLTDGGGTWQGCTIATTVLTELAPGGPRNIGNFQSTSTSGAGAPVLDQDEYGYEGHITAVAPGKSFTVTYTGSRRFTERYVRGRDGKYQLVGKSRLPTC